MLGVRGRVELGKHWFLPFHLDIGTGDSDFTWQGYAGLGYAFKWGGPVLGYRYISFDQGDEVAVRRLSFGGPELAGSGSDSEPWLAGAKQQKAR